MPVPAGNPVAIIQIVMHAGPEGLPIINATFQGPNRDIFNMMMARAQQDVPPLLIEKEKQKVVAPEPGEVLALGK